MDHFDVVDHDVLSEGSVPVPASEPAMNTVPVPVPVEKITPQLAVSERPRQEIKPNKKYSPEVYDLS